MCVDEARQYVLVKHTKVRGRVKVIESDHNPIFLKVNLPWEAKVRKPRMQIFNLRNRECQDKYLEYTNNCDFLTKCLVNRDIKTGGRLWLKNMKFVIFQNFRKIRLNWKNQNELKINELFDQRTKLNQNSPEMNESDRLIADQIYEKNRSLIIDQISEMTDSSTNLED